MKCLILAAGYATRLYPLTENFPKPLLKVQDKTILDWLVDDIDGAGLVDEYIVISNHKFAHHFQEWAAGKRQKITVVDDGTSTNETRLGAVCDIRFAVDSLGLTGDMLVIAGDNVLEIDAADRIVSMEEKPAQPKSHWVCPPFYYYTSEDAARIPAAIADGCGTDAPGSFIAWLCRHTAVHAMEMPGRRYDIGNLQSYEEVQQQYPGIVK